MLGQWKWPNDTARCGQSSSLWHLGLGVVIMIVACAYMMLNVVHRGPGPLYSYPETDWPIGISS